MATRTETIYHHTCDLCGTERDKADLRRLYGKPVSRGVGIADDVPQADVCGDCESKPVSEVLAVLGSAAERGSQPREIRAKAG